MLKTPWYFEIGWWSPWCFITEWTTRLHLMSREEYDADDEFTHRRWGLFPESWTDWLDGKHTAAIERYYQRKHPEWCENDSSAGDDC